MIDSNTFFDDYQIDDLEDLNKIKKRIDASYCLPSLSKLEIKTKEFEEI